MYSLLLMVIVINRQQTVSWQHGTDGWTDGWIIPLYYGWVVMIHHSICLSHASCSKIVHLLAIVTIEH